MREITDGAADGAMMGAEVPVRWWVLMTGWRLKDVYSNPHINAHYTPAPPHYPHRSHSLQVPGEKKEKFDAAKINPLSFLKLFKENRTLVVLSVLCGSLFKVNTQSNTRRNQQAPGLGLSVRSARREENDSKASTLCLTHTHIPYLPISPIYYGLVSTASRIRLYPFLKRCRKGRT